MEVSNVKSFPVKRLSSTQVKYFSRFCARSFPLSFWDKKEFNRVFLSERGGLSIIAKKGRRYAGFILGRLVCRDIFISLLFVVPSFRNQGLATRLVNDFKRKAKKNKNVERIILIFREQNELEEFYEKLGFSNCRIVGNYKNGDKKYQMELRLK